MPSIALTVGPVMNPAQSHPIEKVAVFCIIYSIWEKMATNILPCVLFIFQPEVFYTRQLLPFTPMYTSGET